jgi:predicted ATPase
MLSRVRIRGFKSLVDVEIELGPLAVLFGSNAAGKSNFLDALQLLSRMAAAPHLQSAFELPYRGAPLESFTFPKEGIEGLLNQERATFSIEADVNLSNGVVDEVDRLIRAARTGSTDVGGGHDAKNGGSFIRERHLRYYIEVEVIPRSGVLRVSDERLTALTESGMPNQRRKPYLERFEDRLHLRREHQSHPIYHDRYLDHAILSTRLYPPHYPHLVGMQCELARWCFFYFEPRERMRAATPIKEVDHVGLMGEELPAFLNTLYASEPKRFGSIERALRMIIPSVSGVQVRPDRLGRVELSLLEGGTPVPASIVSEGTLRVLGLLSLGGASRPPALIGFEEPEIGVHPRRIRAIAEYLKTRAASEDSQLIVTTHSPLLLDELPEEVLYSCHKENGSTRIRRFEAMGMYRGARVDDVLNTEDGLPRFSERLVRGDLDD